MMPHDAQHTLAHSPFNLTAMSTIELRYHDISELLITLCLHVSNIKWKTPDSANTCITVLS